MRLRPTAKDRAKLFLERRGIFLKRDRSLRFGIDLWRDLARLGLENSARTIVFDVGANRGSWTRELLLRFPRVSVHAFEPVPETFSHLNEEFGPLNNVTLNQVAVSNHESGAEMRIYDGDVLSSIEPIKNFSDSALKNILKVPTTTIDSYASRHGMASIKLLKSDTEGHDLSVLRGAFLSDVNRIELVFVEVEFHQVNEPHSRFFEVYDFMLSKYFVLVTIYTEYADRNVGFKYGSALFMRRPNDGEGSDR